VPLPADDDVIVHRNAERVGHRDDLLRHLDVGVRGGRIAGRMIVHERVDFFSYPIDIAKVCENRESTGDVDRGLYVLILRDNHVASRRLMLRALPLRGVTR
jgi:hypothetical protein